MKGIWIQSIDQNVQKAIIWGDYEDQSHGVYVSWDILSALLGERHESVSVDFMLTGYKFVLPEEFT